MKKGFYDTLRSGGLNYSEISESIIGFHCSLGGLWFIQVLFMLTVHENNFSRHPSTVNRVMIDEKLIAERLKRRPQCRVVKSVVSETLVYLTAVSGAG